jgi:hypothetical protein
MKIILERLPWLWSLSRSSSITARAIPNSFPSSLDSVPVGLTLKIELLLAELPLSDLVCSEPKVVGVTSETSENTELTESDLVTSETTKHELCDDPHDDELASTVSASSPDSPVAVIDIFEIIFPEEDVGGDIASKKLNDVAVEPGSEIENGKILEAVSNSVNSSEID